MLRTLRMQLNDAYCDACHIESRYEDRDCDFYKRAFGLYLVSKEATDKVEIEVYKALKDRFIQHVSRTSSSRLNLLLKDLQPGDIRPSLLLNELRNLALENMEDDIPQIL
ncbi:hypothetical protein NPIL_469261 [Nephila pilipes]|uniref:Uncharacterized protein n=1 Tax=Nephila pilipes TaxID=299642 RepID=A0A8X6Q3N3_NEPPI|nr:hypothetical protein NPIL_469261 [Nephila pilipes]